MGWSLRTLILTMVLVGCGGGASDVLPIGFVNQTQHSAAELWTIWRSAQQSLARKVDLNPLQRSDPGAIADLRPGDSRALHEAHRASVDEHMLDLDVGELVGDDVRHRASPQP